jgi:hypothetical protein
MVDTVKEAKAVKDKIVTFVTDVAGFCRGDVINLAHESFDKDLVAKIPKSAYVTGEVAQSDLDPIEPAEEE